MDSTCQLCSLIQNQEWSEVISFIDKSEHLLDQDGMALVRLVQIYLDYLERKSAHKNESASMFNLWKTEEVNHSEVRQNVFKILGLLMVVDRFSNFQSSVDEALLTAIRTHDQDLVALLLEHGADPNKIGNKDQLNSFGFSIILDNFEMVKLLFQYGAKINGHCGSGQTPLQLSVDKNLEICKFLLKHEANMDPVINLAERPTPVELFGFPIFNAVYAGNTFLVSALIENGADVNEPYQDSRENPFHLVLKHGTLPLHLAVQQTNVEMVKTLIKYGAFLNEVSGRGHTPLGLAILANSANGDTIVDILLTAGCSRQKETVLFFFHRYYPPLFIACFVGKTSVVKRLLDEDVSMLTLKASDGATPLFMAAHENHLSLVEYLLSLGADHRFTCYHGNFVHAAVHGGNKDILSIALKLGCDVDHINQGGNRPLMLAVSGGNFPQCELLVKHGALLNAVDRFDYTPLIRSAMNDDTEVSLLLLQHGASCHITDSNGRSPLYWALVNKNRRIARLLLLLGATIVFEEENKEIAILFKEEFFQPMSLLNLCLRVTRTILSSAAGGTSIEKSVMSLQISHTLKDFLLLNYENVILRVTDLQQMLFKIIYTK